MASAISPGVLVSTTNDAGPLKGLTRIGADVVCGLDGSWSPLTYSDGFDSEDGAAYFPKPQQAVRRDAGYRFPHPATALVLMTPGTLSAHPKKRSKLGSSASSLRSGLGKVFETFPFSPTLRRFGRPRTCIRGIVELRRFAPPGVCRVARSIRPCPTVALQTGPRRTQPVRALGRWFTDQVGLFVSGQQHEEPGIWWEWAWPRTRRPAEPDMVRWTPTGEIIHIEMKPPGTPREVLPVPATEDLLGQSEPSRGRRAASGWVLFYVRLDRWPGGNRDGEQALADRCELRLPGQELTTVHCDVTDAESRLIVDGAAMP